MKKNKSIALIMAIVLCLSMLFSIAFIILEADHDHGVNEEHCRICLEIEACIKALGRLGLSILLFFALSALLIPLLYTFKQFAYKHQLYTLISLKVKLTI